MFRQDFSCPALLKDLEIIFPYGAVTRSGPPFQTLPVDLLKATGLFRVRSPLLAESLLMSFPPATEMFQFARFASSALWIRPTIPQLRGGFPHSEIHGSTGARPSPRLIAACYVLPRLSVPRHPPNALKRLILANPKPARAARPRSAKLAQLSSHIFIQSNRPTPIKLRPSPRRLTAARTRQRNSRPARGQSLHSLSTMTNSDCRFQQSGFRNQASGRA